MTLRWTWIAAFAVFVACIPLFALDHYFYGDWPNHLGMIGYFGEYIKAHAGLPAMFHTKQTVGRATPMFYGNSFMPVLGAMSVFLGPRSALCVAVAALLLLQFSSVRGLFWDITRDEVVACGAAIIVTWAIYPLSDLYNRSAFPEFFAITELQTGWCLWALYARDPARRDRTGLAAGLLLTMAATTHPPTALFGGLTFAALWLGSLTWCPDRPRLLKRSLLIGAAALGVMAPWLYVAAKFNGQLQIVQNNTDLLFWKTSIDTLSTRLSFMPTVGLDPKAITTPYLDAQVSMPLALVLALLGIAAVEARAWDRKARPAFAFAAVSAVATVCMFTLSLWAPAWKVLPKAFKMVQFAYRLVAFVNVAAMGVLMGLLGALGRDHAQSSRSRLILTVGVLLAMVAVGFKVPRCLGPGGGADAVVHDYENPPGDWYYGDQAYATPDQFTKVDGSGPKGAVQLSVGGANGFGVVGPTHVNLAVRTLVTTNVHAFPWNGLTVDGQPVPREATLRDKLKLATWVGPGEHVMGYAFRPDRTWSVLRALSLILLAGWTLAAALGPALARALARRRDAAPAPQLATSAPD
jgi:hypothetical protein